jgi:glycosyltransferase involved in cell wall biosynthesis
VVILHSDAFVANDWLDRLAYHAQSEPGIASVAPFSNRGGTVNYPRLHAPNRLPDTENLARLDRFFARANAKQSVALPLLSGPCLYLRREPLAAVGPFDSAPLRTDWGVEIDYCFRASGVGFRHLLAGDVFVGHTSHASFGVHAATEAERSEQALSSFYPQYAGERTALRARDEARQFARRVDLLRLAEWPQPLVIFIAHAWGGGIRRHMNDLTALARGRCEMLYLEPVSDDTVKLFWPRAEEEFAAYFTLPGDLAELTELLKSLRVARLHYHHVHLLPRAILDLPAMAGLPYDCTLHDYYPICPQYHLVTAEGRYCGEPAPAGCAACIAQRPNHWNLDITAWRSMFEQFLGAAERVIAPSADVAKRVRRYFPARTINVWPHPEVDQPQPQSIVRVVVLGSLSPEKGLRVVAACAQDAKLRGLPLTFRVLGSTTEPVMQSPDVPLSIFGQYDDAQLPQLLAAEKPDVIFFPAQVPETYSYTLTVAVAFRAPIVASSLGALAERLAGYARATTVRWNASPAEWNAALLSAAGVDTHSATSNVASLAVAVTQ